MELIGYELVAQTIMDTNLIETLITHLEVSQDNKQAYDLHVSKDANP